MHTSIETRRRVRETLLKAMREIAQVVDAEIPGSLADSYGLTAVMVQSLGEVGTVYESEQLGVETPSDVVSPPTMIAIAAGLGAILALIEDLDARAVMFSNMASVIVQTSHQVAAANERRMH